jgi:hypothetical protein
MKNNILSAFLSTAYLKLNKKKIFIFDEWSNGGGMKERKEEKCKFLFISLTHSLLQSCTLLLLLFSFYSNKRDMNTHFFL